MRDDLITTPTDGPTDPAGGGFAGRLPWVLAGLGLVWAVALRFVALLHRWPLHIDELRVTQNLAERGVLGLVRPLDYQQFTPVGVLWVLNGLAETFGYAQWSLQLWPMLAGIGAVVVTGVWAWRAMGPWAGVVAIGLLGSAPKMIEHGIQVKQYSTEMLAASCVLLAGWCLLHRPGRWSVTGWGVVCVLAVLFSHAAVFMIAGVGVAIGLAQLRGDERKRLAAMALATLPSAGIFLTLYLINYRHGADTDMLASYWKPDFMPRPGSGEFVAWWPKRVVWLLSPVGYPYTVIAAVGFLAGVVWLVVARRWALAMTLALPIVFTLLAAVAQAYPFGGRMVVFLAPLVAGLIGAGIDWGINALPRRWRAVGPLVVLGLVVAWSVQAPVRQPMNTGGRYAIGEAWAVMDDPGEPILVDSVLKYHYWQACRTGDCPVDWPMQAIVQSALVADTPGRLALGEVTYAIPPGSPSTRFWVIVPASANLRRDAYGPTREAVLGFYADRCRLIDEYTTGGVLILRFENLPTTD